MSDEINDGGPAFPVSRETALSPITDMGGNDVSSGMSLRDYYAGQALAGMCAYHGRYGYTNGPGEIALRAYEIADAMLAERTKRGGR